MRDALAKTQRKLAGAEEKRSRHAPVQPVQPAPVPAPAPEPPAPAPVAAGPAERNVETLAALVTRYAGEFPEQAEEWRWYLQSLRDIADISGGLPLSVDGLVHDVFGPLLARAARD